MMPLGRLADTRASQSSEAASPSRMEIARRCPAAAAAFSAPSNRTHHELLLIEVGEDAQSLPAGRHVGLYHFGLKVGDTDDELRDALRTVQEAGVTLVGTSDHTVTHSLYVLDPDGNELELYVDVPGVNWRTDPALVFSPIRPLAL